MAGLYCRVPSVAFTASGSHAAVQLRLRARWSATPSRSPGSSAAQYSASTAMHGPMGANAWTRWVVAGWWLTHACMLRGIALHARAWTERSCRAPLLCAPRRFGGRGARARFQKSYR